jgi:hypothetical protein
MAHTHTHTQRLCDHEDVTSLWHQAAHTDREDTANRTDIVIKPTDNVAVTADRNVTQKEAEKKLKYSGLCTETQRMWNMTFYITPETAGATGIVTHVLKKHFEPIPWEHSVDSVQKKTAVLGTSHIMREVLQCETGTVSGGDRRWFKRSAGEKMFVTGNNNNNNNNNNPVS